MSKTVVFDYAVGQRVMVIELKQPAVVRALLVGTGGVKEYKVTYYWNGARVENWVHPDEIRDYSN